MERNLIASGLAIVVSIAMASSSHAQGSLIFENNDFVSLNAPVTYYGTGVRVGSEFKADLLYSLDGGTTFMLLTAANAAAVGGAIRLRSSEVMATRPAGLVISAAQVL
jgi:hypothetical protein